nr:hypothetical protein [Tanacetum cinerariifolium]
MSLLLERLLILSDTLRKDDVEMALLHELEGQMELRALKKELFIQKLVRNVPFCRVEAESVAYGLEGVWLVDKINRVAREVNSVVITKDQFLEELDSLGVRHVPSKMAEFLREIQMSDKETVAKLQILRREIELNAGKKDLFIQKLKGKGESLSFLSVAGETVSMKTGVFLEEMMNKEGSREWQFHGLEKKDREIAFKIDSFLLKLMDEEPSHRSVFGGDDGQRGAISEDQRLAWQINAMCDTLTDIIDERENLIQELDVLASMFVPGKMGEIMKESQRKDIPNLMKLQILRREFELKAQEKEFFTDKLKGNMEF